MGSDILDVDVSAVTVKKAPSTEEVMSKTADIVKIEDNVIEEVEEAASATAGLPVHAKLAHLLAVIVSGVIAVAVATVLADGTSVIKLKDPQYLPVVTSPVLKADGIYHRLDVLLGPTYGVGLHHDQSGHSWYAMAAGSTLQKLVDELGMPVVIAALPSVIASDDLKHPVPFLSCDMLQMAGICAMTFGYIAEVVAVIMIIFHGLALGGLLPAKCAKILAGLVWLVLCAGFLIVILLAKGIYTAEWECHNPVIPSIRLADHFNYNYGFPYAIAGFISSLLILSVVLGVTSSKDGVRGEPVPSLGGALCKTLCCITSGLILAVALGFAVAGGNGIFYEAPPPDGLRGPPVETNKCEGAKPYHAGPGQLGKYSTGDHYFSNVDCMQDAVTQTLEQAGANVTKGYKGLLDAGDRVPIIDDYHEAGLCPVNVHWHLGAEHMSVGQFDDNGQGPHHAVSETEGGMERRKLGAGSVREGMQCHHYKADDAKFTTPYDWQHCDSSMEVGQTYEIHWPHSAAGDCGGPYQYQTPFYDGVFCNYGIITIMPLNTYQKIGVQAQVFTIVNDESYYNGDLINGAIRGNGKWEDVAKYTGSTTGTSRDNVVCSRFTPITWQVDRTCHMISASSFDKLCQDMKGMRDDMSGDLHAHGARALVDSRFVANNQQSRSRE